MPRAGTRQAYRPMPPDFVQRWPSVGWDDAEAEWRAHARTIARWLDETGRRAELERYRAEHVRQQRAQAAERRRRYVLGRTLTRKAARIA